MHFVISFQCQQHEVKMSVKSAETLFLETSEKALKGDVEAQNYLGYMYACGLGNQKGCIIGKTMVSEGDRKESQNSPY